MSDRPAPGSLDASLDLFVAGLDHGSWFAALGEALTPSERADAEGYLSGLGFGGVAVHQVGDWDQARAAIQDPNWDREWWNAAERERQALLLDAKRAHAEAALMAGLSRVTQAATRRMAGVAAEAAAHAGIADQGLIKAASGAASEAVYQAALALAAAAAASHPFRLKYNLFEAGHWPLAVIGDRLDLF